MKLVLTSIEYLNQPTTWINMKNIISLFSFIFLFACANKYAAQDLPNCNLYQFTITEKASGYSVLYPKFLTAFNKNGYNNQPSFISDFDLYLTSNYGDNGSTEVIKLNLFENKLTRVTSTKQYEYSPTAANKNYFSTVRVENDKKTQTLTLYPNNMDSSPRRFLPELDNVGYHTWISDSEVALFLVDESQDHVLAIGNVYDDSVSQIVSGIGRTLKFDGGHKLFFIHKSVDKWFIKEYNTETRKIRTVIETIESVEDFELLRNGTFICGKGSKLYFYNKGTAGWTVITDLKDYGIESISRIAIRKNKLILVNNS